MVGYEKIRVSDSNFLNNLMVQDVNNGIIAHYQWFVEFIELWV